MIEFKVNPVDRYQETKLEKFLDDNEYEWKTAINEDDRLTVEEIENVVNNNLLPFADGEWRNDYPDDGYRWNVETIKQHANMIAKAIKDAMNKKEGDE